MTRGYEPLAGFSELMSEIVQASLSENPDALNELVRESSLLRSVLYETLGMETATFFVFDRDVNAMRLFDRAVPEGINPAFVSLTKLGPGSNSRGGKYHAEPWPVEEQEKVRQDQEAAAAGIGKQTTARLCFDALNSGRRRSAAEEKREWLLFPTGEIAVFCFEWSLWKRLEAEGVASPEEARERIRGVGFAESCWDDIFGGNTFPRMANRGDEYYRAAIRWLGSVTADTARAKYAYLWDCDEEAKSWFVRLSRDVQDILGSAKRPRCANFDVLRRLADLILLGSRIPHDSSRVGIQNAGFFNRSWLSPEMSLKLGQWNLCAFLLRPRFSADRGQPTEAVLLGNFRDVDICQKRHREIKDILCTLATRDISRFSEARLARSLDRLSHVTQIIMALNENTFIHEIRGPLAKVKVRIDEILKEPQIPDAAVERASKIKGDVERAQQAVRALRDVTKALSGSTEVVDLGLAVHSSYSRIQRFKLIPIPNRIQIKRDIARTKLPVVLGKDALSVILTNLLANAIDATDGEGTITLVVKRAARQATLEVRDTGSGFPEGVPDSLFDRKPPRPTGMGLGLFICRHIAGVYGGAISAQNRAVGGANFILTFPLAENGGGK